MTGTGGHEGGQALRGPAANTVVLAGATGALGGRIARALAGRGAAVTALVRTGTPPGRVAALEADGIRVAALDLDDVGQVAAACTEAGATGAACVVSALNGLEPTMLGTQGALLRGAVAAGVPRFIPSDFSLDFTGTAPGRNRNLDLRRAFHAQLDRAPLRATSILNGAFADLLTGPMPLILFGLRRVIHWGEADQPLDFTAMDDVAAFTAAAALDPETPRILRVAGAQASPRDLAAMAGAATGRQFRTLRLGAPARLDGLIRLAQVLAPGRGQVFPPWQGLQYLRDMFEGRGRLAPLDNDRYPGLRWTGLPEILGRR
ncbi:NmrA family NAD(P)-binding protein [Methylobacterium planeticum]|uniref:NAD(P)H-binding protein n=1 Tax=Methylobacterium planeticum TaxID=2615211 RepID=A0A6N6MSQ0_9HYPH|nr:NmrA family NAD(P)-binding protein [Methylobacterium planeticum]KAB1074311.1 NAD(P)H-binding protein [Methylobacterium planeticum]